MLRCSRTDVRNLIASLGSIPLLAAMAILAAAVGDPIVEAVASSGLFGSGYHDADRSSVLASGLAGLVLAAGAFVLRCCQEWRTSPHRLARRRASRATAGFEIPPLLQLAIVFGLQLSIVLGMQTSEDLLAGRAIDLHAWLGGPAWFALTAYGAICVGLTSTLRRFMRSFVTKVVDDLRAAQRRLRARTRSGACKPTSRSLPSRVLGALDPSVRRTRGRAPPLQLEPA
jgi:hypothetical protein